MILKKNCSALRYLLKIAEEEFYNNRLKLMGRDLKRNWCTLNDLLGRKQNKKHFHIN